VAAPGSPGSPGQLAQHVVVEFLLRQQPLQPRVLLLQLLQPNNFLGAHRPVLHPPALLALDQHLQPPADRIQIDSHQATSLVTNALAIAISNRTRRHSAVGMLTPIEYETVNSQTAKAA
jgi:hypothetical protein